ncbi:MAG: hypothetical protein ACE5J5_02290 [Candidatus Hydrothermarchaeales archaeon]
MRKDKNLEIWFSLQLSLPNKKRTPSWHFELYERKSESKFFRNILRGSKKFEKKIKKINVPLIIYPVARYSKGMFHFDGEVELVDFKPKEHIRTIRNKKHLFIGTVEEFWREGKEGKSMYEGTFIQDITEELFLSLKLILDEYL